MSLLTPDLTGTNINCKVENDVRVIVTDNQVVEFHDSVYANSLDITLLGTVNKKMLKNQDFKITTANIDYEAMGAMKLKDPEFNKQLLKSVTIIKPHAADFKLSFTYQRLYPLPSTLALRDYPTKVEFTPEAWIDVVEMVKRHDLLLSPIKDQFGEAYIKQAMLLEPDPLQQRNANKIKDELYEIDVPNRVAVIHPIHGAFFKDSLKVYQVISGTSTQQKRLLTLNEDYIVYGLDSAKTSNTPNPSGVYKFICFIKPFANCYMSLDYHAYGGDPSIEDLKAHDESISNITDYILHAELLTATTVSNAPVIINMINKLTSLEEEMRRLANEGRPNYGDATSGSTLLLKLHSTDTKTHWWTIAELYKVSGSDEIFTAGTMKLNVQSAATKMQFSVDVVADLNNPSNKFSVYCTSSLVETGYVPYENYTNLEYIIRPQFRIIWNENTVQKSGAYLQLGFRLPYSLTDTIAVEDVSGRESCWKLIPSPDYNNSNPYTNPDDDVITLPSENHVWSTANTDSRVSTYLVPLKDGNIVWAGEFPLNRPESGIKTLFFYQSDSAIAGHQVHLLEQNIDLSRIKRVRCDLVEGDLSIINKFPVFIDLNSDDSKLFGTTSFYYNGKPAYLYLTISRNTVSNKIEIILGADVVAGLAGNRLSLRHLIIYS